MSEHRAEVWRRQHDGRVVSWTPRCPCGWQGSYGLTREEAEQEAAQHDYEYALAREHEAERVDGAAAPRSFAEMEADDA